MLRLAMQSHLDQGKDKTLPLVIPILFYHGQIRIDFKGQSFRGQKIGNRRLVSLRRFAPGEGGKSDRPVSLFSVFSSFCPLNVLSRTDSH
jgi:hypothetical protein